MSKDLNEHIKDHFEKVRPGPGQMRRLMEMAALKKPPKPRFSVATWQWAALIPLAVLMGGLWFEGLFAPHRSTLSEIAAEIAANHDKYDAPAVHAESYDALREAFSGGGFDIIRPEEWAGAGYKLLGGRYCSLLGQKAVQIHFVDQQGERVTLYQTKAAPRFAETAEAGVEVGAKTVRLWTEGNVYIGLATEEEMARP